MLSELMRGQTRDTKPLPPCAPKVKPPPSGNLSKHKVHGAASMTDEVSLQPSMSAQGHHHQHGTAWQHSTQDGHHHHGTGSQPSTRHNRHSRRGRSNLWQWAAAVVFTVLAILVLVAALVVLLVVLVLQPKAPRMTVGSAHLNSLVYDQEGVLDTELYVAVVAENGNTRTGASFSDVDLSVRFQDTVIALLRADPFDVPRNGTWPLGYLVRSSGVPLDAAGQDAMGAALADGVVPFGVSGSARARWKVGAVVPVTSWAHLSCQLRFFWPNGTALDVSCR